MVGGEGRGWVVGGGLQLASCHKGALRMHKIPFLSEAYSNCSQLPWLPNVHLADWVG